MPIRKDGSGLRWVEMELVVPGTPEQVWEAIATGPGYTAWFAPTTIEQRVGGELRFDLGDYGASKGEVTLWKPPTHFGYVEREWGEGAPDLATEITVTARSGNRCVIRMVHSLFAATDDWDDQMEGFEKGWPAFFQVLQRYLSHFTGQNAAVSSVMISLEQPQSTVWNKLTESLNLAGANAGDERSTNAPEPLAAIVERVEQDDKQRYILLRLTQPSPGMALISTYGFGDTTNFGLTFYYYGDDAETRAAVSGPLWRSWCEQLFPAPGEPECL